MTDLTRVFFGVALFCTGVVGGGFLAINVIFRRATRVLEGGPQIELHIAAAKGFYRIMPPAMIISTLAGVGVLIAEDGLGTRTIALDLAGAALILLSAITTIIINVPINRLVGSWSGGPPPPGQAEINRRWGFGNSLRAVLALTALLLYILAVLTA
jgi:hypothetical protein